MNDKIINSNNDYIINTPSTVFIPSLAKPFSSDRLLLLLKITNHFYRSLYSHWLRCPRWLLLGMTVVEVGDPLIWGEGSFFNFEIGNWLGLGQHAMSGKILRMGWGWLKTGTNIYHWTSEGLGFIPRFVETISKNLWMLTDRLVKVVIWKSLVKETKHSWLKGYTSVGTGWVCCC
jgi:hypothetical protein